VITEQKIQSTQALFTQLQDELGKVIVGHRRVLEGTLIAMLCGGNVLLESVPGLGKTLIVRSMSKVLGLKFSRIQFTPDLMPADIIGTNLVMEDEHGRRYFEFSPGPIFAHLILADEINRATPKTQAALLEAMQERSVTVGKQTFDLEQPFAVLATQNPIEMEGTYPLPEAQVDRFFFRLFLEPPNTEELEEIISRNTSSEGNNQELETTISRDQLLEARDMVEAFPIAEPLSNYAARLILATHPDQADAPELVKKYVSYGASPRAGISLVAGAKAHAFLNGASNVRLEDIRAIYPMALNHRVLLNFKAQSEGVTVGKVLDQVLSQLREM
jgi:MoxR-like ATPase